MSIVEPTNDLLAKVENRASREDLLLRSLHPSIDQESPAFKADLETIERIATEEAARTALGLNGFDWDNNDAVVLREQSAIALHRDHEGNLIIRQKAGWDEETDTLISIAPENIVSFLESAAAFLRKEQDGGRS